MVTIDDAAEDAWVYETFSEFGATERALWIARNNEGKGQVSLPTGLAEELLGSPGAVPSPENHGMRSHVLIHGLAAAIVLTLANAPEPVRIDDAAYVAQARHFLADPLHPYFGEIFWWEHPTPSLEVMSPPVFQYGLAAAMALVGETVLGWKLLLFPLSVMASFAILDLAGRFLGQGGMEETSEHQVATLWLVVLSPACLSGFNLMLDVPALAIGLTALALGIGALERSSTSCWLASALLAAIAAQTKYSAVSAGVMLALWAIQSRRYVHAVAVATIGTTVFFGWELYVYAQHGSSMLLHALRESVTPNDAIPPSQMLVATALILGPALPQTLPLLASAAGLPRQAPAVIGALIVGVYFAVALVPISFWPNGSEIGLMPNLLYYVTLGAWAPLLLLLASATLWRLTRRANSKKWFTETDVTDIFLACWLGCELLIAVIASPFPAMRRTIGITLPLVLLLVRVLIASVSPAQGRSAVVSAVSVALIAGPLFQLTDLAEATAVKNTTLAAIERAERAAGDKPVWYSGHWGMQYYCERVGLKAVDPGVSRLKAGDVAIIARKPHERPNFSVDVSAVDRIESLTGTSLSPWAVAPLAYSGIRPIDRKTGPTVVLDIYRVRQDWTPG